MLSECIDGINNVPNCYISIKYKLNTSLMRTDLENRYVIEILVINPVNLAKI